MGTKRQQILSEKAIEDAAKTSAKRARKICHNGAGFSELQLVLDRSIGRKRHRRLTSTGQVAEQIYEKYVKGFRMVRRCRMFGTDKAFSMALAKTEPLVLAGSKDGSLAIWNFYSSMFDGVLPKQEVDAAECQQVHSANVTAISCLPHTSQRFLSGSYDKTVAVFDIEKMVRTNIVVHSEDGITTMDVCDFKQLGVACDYAGRVHLFDTRNQRPTGRSTNLHHRKIGSVRIHPMCTDLMVTGSNDNTVKLWDLRRLSSPLRDIPAYRAVKATEFSPCGTMLLVSALDNYFRIYTDVTSSNEHLKVYHNNATGRWITDFAPTWHPTIPNLFVSGTLERHAVELYNIDGRQKIVRAHSFKDEFSKSITSFSTFHSAFDVLVSISYGRASLWTYVPSDLQLPNTAASSRGLDINMIDLD